MIRLPRLNLPQFDHKFRQSGSKVQIFDPLRNKYLVLTPEEWVRQSFIKLLTQNLSYPSSRLKEELKINVFGLIKRCDLVVFNNKIEPVALFEFKAPNVEISQKTAEQAGIYNIKLKIRNLVISNGMKTFWLKMNSDFSQWSIQERIPEYYELE